MGKVYNGQVLWPSRSFTPRGRARFVSGRCVSGRSGPWEVPLTKILQAQNTYSPPEVDGIWLGVYYSKLPIYPIFYLREGDYKP